MTRLMERRIIESDLRLRIEQLFKNAVIVIGFFQRDVHLDSQKPIEIRMFKSKDNGGIYDEQKMHFHDY
jgi:small-conductance mechanosensitive channel